MKTMVTVTVEAYIMEEARKRGINISEAAEAGITLACDLPPVIKKTPDDKISQVIALLDLKAQQDLVATIERNAIFAKGQARLIAMKTGILLKKEEVLALVGRIRGGV